MNIAVNQRITPGNERVVKSSAKNFVATESQAKARPAATAISTPEVRPRRCST